MKKILFVLLINLTVITAKAQDNTQWNVQPNHQLELNYNLMGRSIAQGVFYGAAGYGMGMWVSGNKTWVGMVGSVIAANLPLFIDGRYKQKEVLIGRNLGALSIGLGATFYIEMSRRGRLNYTISPLIQRR